MSLDIVELQEKRQRALIKRASKLVKPLTLPIRDSPAQAPGYRDFGITYSLGEGEYSRDPAVTAAIRVFDPQMIPLWVRWVFLSPSDTGNPELVVFGRHAVGAYIDNPSFQKEPLKVEIPSDYIGPIPNHIDFIWQGDLDPKYVDLPGAYKPWDWSLFAFCQANYIANKFSVSEQKDQIIFKPKAEQEERIRKQAIESFKMKADFEKYIEKKLDQISDLEAKEHYLGLPFREKKRKLQF